MIHEKQLAISCAKYSLEEYLDYFAKVYAVYNYYRSAGDFSSADICKQWLMEIPEMLSNVVESSGSIAELLSDQPVLMLPEEYLALIEELKTTR